MKRFIIITFLILFSLFIVSCKKADNSIHLDESLKEASYKKVIILTGQSNATGVSHSKYIEEKLGSDIYKKYEKGFSNVKIMYQADANSSADFVDVKLGQGNNPELFGPEIGIAESLEKFNPKETYYIIKCTFSGTSLEGQWLQNGERFDLYNKLVDFVKKAMDKLGDEYKIFACCFMQGESDGAIGAHKKYYNNLDKLTTYLRSDLKDYKVDEDIYFIDAGIAQNWKNYKKINQAKIDFASSSSKNAYIDTVYEGLDNSKEPKGGVDRAHYDALSEIKLGNLFGKELITLLKESEKYTAMINDPDELYFDKHIFVARARNLNEARMTNLEYNEETGKIILAPGEVEGVYESGIINTLNFYRLVGSFSCITGEHFTAELEYSIKVDGKWSKFLSYRKFGLGRKNIYYNQTDTDAKIDTDMIIPLNDKVGTAFKYKITLRRDVVENDSPELSLIATAIFINDYKYDVDTTNLPLEVDYEVPMLNQNWVPGIGNVICSATTTTMLLEFAGIDFSNCGYEYEHEYMAKLVADTGHNNPTYGNWSYNMMAAGGFGVNAYVGKFYSWDEFKYHLANIGPVGVSIGGNFGRYTTSGHLIVVRGYREVDGKTTVICNDPNIEEVYYEVSLDMFLDCLGSVVYIIEFDGKEANNFR